MKTSVKFTRVWKILPDGTWQELDYFGEKQEKPNQVSLVVSVTKRELQNLLSGEADLIFRKSWPTKHINLPAPVYFTIVGQKGKISAKGYLYFIMHSIGTDLECERAATKPEKFEKDFYNPKFGQACAMAWNIRNVELYNAVLSDFIYLPDKSKPCVMKHLTRAFAYVIKK